MKYLVDHNGLDHGEWEGTCELDALASLLTEAGYDCQLVGEELVFDDPADSVLVGDLEAWEVRSVEM